MSSQESRARLAVTLAIPSNTIPAWVDGLRSRLQEADFVAVTMLALEQPARAENSSSLLLDLWMRLETKLFGHKIAARTHSEEPVEAGLQPSPPAEPVDADVVVWMLPGRPPAELIGNVRLGVLTVVGAFDSKFGLSEFLEQVPATRCDVVALGATPAEDRVLVSSFANTDAILFSRGINGIRAKCRALLMAALKRLWLEADPRLDGLPQQPEAPRTGSVPGNLRILWGVTSIFGKFAIASIFPRGRFDQWQLAYRLGEDRLDRTNLKFLAPAHTGFWADPFIAEHDGRRCIFFEELSPETKRGHLAAVEVHADGRTGDPVNVLMSDFHLSYPFLFERDGVLYMVPECSGSGRIEVLRCERFPDRWQPHAVLLDAVTAFDPTLVEHDDRWWMFVTIEHDGNSCNDELHLYYATDVFREWTPHALNPIKLDVRAARPAGALFRENGKLFRPAQDCSGRYGRAISIQEIRRMTPDEYEEVEVQRIPADFAPDALGTHTVNQAHGIVVFDCEVRALRQAGQRAQ